MYTAKFQKLGIPVTEDEIFGSSYSAAIYLSRVLKFPKDKKVYVLGERGVEEELEAEGIQYCGGTSPEDRMEFEESDYDQIKPDQSIGAVLCGLDNHISYKKLAKGLMYLRQSPEVLFLATNTDSTYPTHNTLFPGAGTTTTAPLQFASKRTATTCGKPSQTMMDAIFAKYDLDRERTCMVGDRLDTDIKFGLQGKLGGTLLVLSGVSSLEDCEKEGIWPKFVMDGLGDLGVLEKEEEK
jgi:4-nitrophenyl phosphatase